MTIDQLPVIHRLRGAAPGPTLSLLGGVHGDELEGPLAIERLVRTIEDTPFAGEVRWAAPAHPAAWAACTRLSPVDGQNLARVFPGSAQGSSTERVAWHLTTELIAGSDLLVDLHSAGDSFDMPLMAGYITDGSSEAERAEAATRAFAAPFTWLHPDPSPGRSLAAASALGIPAIYVEGRGGGQIRKVDLDHYVAGLIAVMRHLDMFPGASEPTPSQPLPTVRVSGDGNTDGGLTSGAEGYCATAVSVGQRVERHDLLAEIWTDTGQLVAEVRAPYAGRVMLLKRRSRVQPGDGIAIIAAEVPNE